MHFLKVWAVFDSHRKKVVDLGLGEAPVSGDRSSWIRDYTTPWRSTVQSWRCNNHKPPLVFQQEALIGYGGVKEGVAIMSCPTCQNDNPGQGQFPMEKVDLKPPVTSK